MKWKDKLCETFLETFTRLYASFIGTCTRDNVLHSISDFKTLYKEAGACMKRLGCRAPRNIDIQPDWWHNTCNKLKSEKYSHLRTFQHTNAIVDYELYVAK